ncbi:hypothetical protein B0H16DRAFT_1823355 [Mycena metata]|uniref:Uncharacterized protein n=1 Tax=Mycena metata TaxID=1033252 RepID=A0AAD7MAM1_9AGAR|nr:hypothetical protein B0H16DRAFT_1823355 [Mycena metata]
MVISLSSTELNVDWISDPTRLSSGSSLVERPSGFKACFGIENYIYPQREPNTKLDTGAEAFPPPLMRPFLHDGQVRCIESLNRPLEAFKPFIQFAGIHSKTTCVMRTYVRTDSKERRERWGREEIEGGDAVQCAKVGPRASAQRAARRGDLTRKQLRHRQVRVGAVCTRLKGARGCGGVWGLARRTRKRTHERVRAVRARPARKYITCSAARGLDAQAAVVRQGTGERGKGGTRWHTPRHRRVWRRCTGLASARTGSGRCGVVNEGGESTREPGTNASPWRARTVVGNEGREGWGTGGTRGGRWGWGKNRDGGTHLAFPTNFAPTKTDAARARSVHRTVHRRVDGLRTEVPILQVWVGNPESEIEGTREIRKTQKRKLTYKPAGVLPVTSCESPLAVTLVNSRKRTDERAYTGDWGRGGGTFSREVQCGGFWEIKVDGGNERSASVRGQKERAPWAQPARAAGLGGGGDNSSGGVGTGAESETAKGGTGLGKQPDGGFLSSTSRRVLTSAPEGGVREGQEGGGARGEEGRDRRWWWWWKKAEGGNVVMPGRVDGVGNGRDSRWKVRYQPGTCVEDRGTSVKK